MTRKTKKIIYTWFWRIMVIVIAALLFSINGNQQNIMVMQTDAMDKLNEISVSVKPEELEPSPVEPTAYILSPEERDLICRVVAAEARGEDLQTMMGVAQVIRDRSTAWNMPIGDVVFATGQFALPYDGEISDEIQLAVSNVFDGRMSVLEVPTTHFHDDSVDPYWTGNKVDRGSVGGLRFWY